MYDAVQDPYTYEGTTVLKNKLDLQDQAELDAFETEISFARAQEPLPDGKMDFDHYKAIHHHLFQDVYSWAGAPHRLDPAEMPAAMIASFDGEEEQLANAIRALVV